MKYRHVGEEIRVGRKVGLGLILILAISTMSVFAFRQPVFAKIDPPPSGDNIPTPTVPVFAIQKVNSTGIVITIENQPFTPFEDVNKDPLSFFYNIRVTTNGTATEWTELYDAYYGYPEQSNSTTTVMTANLELTMWGKPSLGYLTYAIGPFLPIKENSILVGSEFSLEVEAIIGYYGREPAPFQAPIVVYGETSGWSNPQIITIPSVTISPTPTSTSTPSIPELSWLVLMPSLLSIFSVAVIFWHRKTAKPNQ